ncbi:MAG: hypothetical protein H0U73_11470 [Tatlockia sp.]|nr:hypothetical protein [Tatlockia sp.]
MKFNTLYRFINEELNQSQGAATAKIELKNFSYKTDKSKNNYLMYELNLNKSNTFITSQGTRYQLISHHISFYEMEDDKNPYLSQYHYTAYFSDMENTHYELHVYLNQNDQLTCKPVFSLKENGQPSETNQESESFMQSLLDYAINETLVLIKPLRQLEQKKRASFVELYNQYESKLSILSLDLKTNKNQYIKLLIETINVLKELVHYTDNPYFESLIKLYQRTKDEIKVAYIADYEELELSEKKTIQVLSVDAPDKTKKTVAKKSLQSFVDRAKTARDLFFADKKLGVKSANKDLINSFLKFHHHTHDILLLADDYNYQIGLSDLQKTQEMALECTKEGHSLLELMLIKKDYASAKNLVPYLSFVQEKMINMALVVDNGPLLDFLLTHGDIAINSFTISKEIKLKVAAESLTPLLYCFNEIKIQCLPVLLKHGASPMVLAADGLPLAHHILSVVTHPLREAFNKAFTNAELVKLYQSLIRFIEGNQQIADLNEEQCTQFSTAISYYERLISILKEVKSAISQQQSKNAQDQVNQLGSKINNKALFVSIMSDKELQKKFDTYSQLGKVYLQKLTVQEKRQELRESPLFKSINQVMDHIDLSQFFDFDLVKSSITSLLNTCIKIVNCKIELIEVRKNVQKPIFAHKPNSMRQQNKSIARYNSLAAEIGRLQKEAGFAEIEKGAAFLTELHDKKTNVLDHLSELINSLNSLLGNLEEPNHTSESSESASELKVIDLESETTPLLENPNTSPRGIAPLIGFYGERNTNKAENKSEVEEQASLEL